MRALHTHTNQVNNDYTEGSPPPVKRAKGINLIQNESTRTLNDITALNHDIAKKYCWIVPYRITCNPIDLANFPY